MSLGQEFRKFATRCIALAARAKQVSTPLAVVAVAATLLANQLVVATCNDFDSGFAYSTVVPCQNASCVAYSSAINGPGSQCVQPVQGNVSAVTVKVTATSWSNCTVAAGVVND